MNFLDITTKYNGNGDRQKRCNYQIANIQPNSLPVHTNPTLHNISEVILSWSIFWKEFSLKIGMVLNNSNRSYQPTNLLTWHQTWWRHSWKTLQTSLPYVPDLSERLRKHFKDNLCKLEQINLTTLRTLGGYKVVYTREKRYVEEKGTTILVQSKTISKSRIIFTIKFKSRKARNRLQLSSKK